jgi:parvulin-like peptidyl-prolyl isomerase
VTEVILGVGLFALSAVGAIIGSLLNRAVNSLESRLSNHGARIDQLEQRTVQLDERNVALSNLIAQRLDRIDRNVEQLFERFDKLYERGPLFRQDIEK